MNSEIIIAAIAAGGGAAVGGIVQLIMWLLNRLSAKKDNYGELLRNTAKGVECVLRDRTKYLAKKFLEAGEVDPDDLEELMDMHRCYKALGGNGYLDTLMEDVKHLPKRG